MQEEEATDHVSPGSKDAEYNAKNHSVQSIIENVFQAWYRRMAYLCFQATLWVWVFVGFVSFLVFLFIDTQEYD